MADIMSLTADKLKGFGIIDKIVPEPVEGAHRNPEAAIRTVKKYLIAELDELMKIPADELVERRIGKYYKMGAVKEPV
jgi:acetyl-CoA carboxylase carboxyl transferase subunit alpha